MDLRIPEIFLSTRSIEPGRRGVPLLLHGEPGIGKTSILKQWIRDVLEAHPEVMIASIRDQTDYGGGLVPNREAGQIDVVPMSWAKRLEKYERTVLFLDEFNNTDKMVMAAQLRLVAEGVCGDYVLPTGVRFIAAANPIESATAAIDLPPAMASRFGHYDLSSSDGVDEWFAYLLADRGSMQGRSLAELEAQVDARWDVEHRQFALTATAFFKANRGEVHSLPEEGDPARSKAWACRRTWDMAIRVGTAARCLGYRDLEIPAVNMCVGDAAAAKFSAFRTALDLPDPANILDRGERFSHNPARPDRTWAVLTSCSYCVQDADDDKELQLRRARALWGVLDAVADKAPDLAMAPAGNLINLGYDHLLCDEAKRVMTSLRATTGIVRDMMTGVAR